MDDDDIYAEVTSEDENKIVSIIQQQIESDLKSVQNWEDFDALKPCMNKFDTIAKRNNLENDSQTRMFAQFLAIASNFASADYNSRLRKIPEIASTIKDLFQEIMREINEFKDVALEVQDIIRTFVQMVNETKHAVNMTLPHIKDVTAHIEMLKDCFDPVKNSSSMTEIDKTDVKIALDGVRRGICNLKQLSYEREQESKEIQTRIDNARKLILDKKLLANHRGLESINEFYEAIYGKIGLSVGGALVGLATRIGFSTTAAAEAGAALIGSVSSVLLAAAIGAVSITSIVLLVKKLYSRHQEKAIEYLNRLLIELEKISEANAFFLSYIQRSKELVNSTQMSFANIQNGICSERYRKMNADMCESIIKDNKDMIQTLNDICSIDLEQWVRKVNNFHQVAIVKK